MIEQSKQHSSGGYYKILRFLALPYQNYRSKESPKVTACEVIDISKRLKKLYFADKDSLSCNLYDS
jgi:hypothetical protein